MTLFHMYTLRDWLLFFGNGAMFACSFFYVIWWREVFRPGVQGTENGAAPFLLLTLGSGIAALVLFILALVLPGIEKLNIPFWVLLCGLVVLYVILYGVSVFLFHRQTTSELLIMTIWSFAEILVLDMLYSEGRFGFAVILILSLLVLLALVTGFWCYIAYYRLEEPRAYADGLIPIMTDGTVVFVFLLLQMIL